MKRLKLLVLIVATMSLVVVGCAAGEPDSTLSGEEIKIEIEMEPSLEELRQDTSEALADFNVQLEQWEGQADQLGEATKAEFDELAVELRAETNQLEQQLDQLETATAPEREVLANDIQDTMANLNEVAADIVALFEAAAESSE